MLSGATVHHLSVEISHSVQEDGVPDLHELELNSQCVKPTHVIYVYLPHTTLKALLATGLHLQVHAEPVLCPDRFSMRYTYYTWVQC